MIQYLFILFLLALPHCSYRPDYQEDAVHAQLSLRQTKENVTVQADILDNEQINRIFKKNIRNSGYQPIAITITNHTPNTLVFRSSYTSLNLLLPEIIAKELHYNIPLTVSGLFIVGYLGFQLFWPLAPFMITAFPMGWQSYKENQKMSETIAQNSLPVDERTVLEIPPFTTVSRFAFVVDRVSYLFEFKLFDVDTKKLIPFQISLYR